MRGREPSTGAPRSRSGVAPALRLPACVRRVALPCAELPGVTPSLCLTRPLWPLPRAPGARLRACERPLPATAQRMAALVALARCFIVERGERPLHECVNLDTVYLQVQVRDGECTKRYRCQIFAIRSRGS